MTPLRAYLLGILTASGLAGGSIALTELAAADTFPQPKQVVVSASYSNALPAVSSIWLQVETAMCPKAETEGGFTSGSCSIEEGTVVSLTRGKEETLVVTSFNFSGSWTKGPVQ